MSPLFVLGLLCWFIVMWCGLYLLAERRRKSIEARVDQRIADVLAREQMAHDSFQATLRRVGRLPE